MASVNFKKLHNGSGEAAAMIGHMLRHDGRDVTYRNQDVNPDLSERNYFVHSKRFDDSTEMILGKLRRRIETIDRDHPPKRIRADRVTLISYTIPCPEGLLEDEQRDFFDIVHEEISRMSGGRQNVTCGVVHMDEIHRYVDKDGKIKESRPHMHMVGIPYVDGIGINGKQFQTKERMKTLNRRIDERCRQELHVGFLTHQEPFRRTVEDLKIESYEALQKKTQELKQVRQNELTQLKCARRAIDAVKEYLCDIERNYDYVEDMESEDRDDVRRDLQDLDVLEDMLDIAEDYDRAHYGIVDQRAQDWLFNDEPDDDYDNPSYWDEEIERQQPDRGFDFDL